MKKESGSSRMDTVLKMLLIAFISLLAFSSGVYFGKQLSDSDYQLRALESDFSHSGFAKVTEEEEDTSLHMDARHDAHADEAINQEEIAALSEQLVDSAKADANKQEESRHIASKEAPAANSKPDLSAASKAAMRVAQNAAPTEPAPAQKEPNRVPTSLPKTVGTSQNVEFTVQVASYPTAQAAREHADELVKKGFPAFPVEATVQGKIWYRVSVGSFKTHKDATMYRAQILKQSAMPSAIVQRIHR